MAWVWSVGHWQLASPPWPLHDAFGRSLQFRVDGPATATFVLDGRSDTAAHVRRREDDLHVWRDGVKLFRGRVVSELHNLNADAHSVACQATDYRGVLSSRVLLSAPSYVGVDQHAIAWQLIEAAQAAPGGAMGITNGLNPSSGTVRTRSDWSAGKPVGECIAELARVQGGFEWEVDADLRLNRWTPLRGRDATATAQLVYGGTVDLVEPASVDRDEGNAVLVVGDDTATTPVAAVAADITTDPRGRWDVVEQRPTVTRQTTLAEIAPRVLAWANRPRQSWWVRLMPDVWQAPSQLWLGDTVALSVHSGRLHVDATVRVEQIDITVGVDGDETVKVLVR